MRGLWILPVFGSVLFLAGEAIADVAPPPPTDCPMGSRGTTNHGTPYCAPTTCNNDADCTSDLKCRPYSLCIQKVSYYSPHAGDVAYDKVVGTCDKGEACAEESNCMQEKRCITPEATPEPSSQTEPSPEASTGPVETAAKDDGGCGCTVVNPRHGWIALCLALLGMGVFVVRDARRNRARGVGRRE